MRMMEFEKNFDSEVGNEKYQLKIMGSSISLTFRKAQACTNVVLSLVLFILQFEKNSEFVNNFTELKKYCCYDIDK